MSFRTKLTIIFLGAVLVPMIVLAILIRTEMTGRLSDQYEERADALVSEIEADIELESASIAATLADVKEAILDDNRFRAAAVDRDRDARRYLLDYAGGAMRMAGLSMLQVQDAEGRILSSGHFRNEFDRLEPDLPRLLSKAPGGVALVEVRTPDRSMIVLARSDRFRIGGKDFTITGGIEIERRFLTGLAREPSLSVNLILEGDLKKLPGDKVVREIPVPMIYGDRKELTQSGFRVTHDMAGLGTLRDSIDRWFFIVISLAALVTIFIVGYLSSRVSRPLRRLAKKTSQLDLDTLDVEFDTDREDEIGTLSKVLAAMTGRLRAGAIRIRDAERRATLGEMARQVNHDIKNGLTPIRNVIRHLSELSKEDPAKLPEVFDERKETLDSSMEYLDDLASNYARLYPRLDRRRCDVSEVAGKIVGDMQGSGPAGVRSDLTKDAFVEADPVALRRIIENLVRNAIDSIGADQGTVTVATDRITDGESRTWVRVTVSDNGIGMSEEQKARIFDDFYTTKKSGTGLGLSIVRRLVMDLDGRIDVESAEGEGTSMTVYLPAAVTGE
jgi:signal transduction histidine kinase